MGERRADIEWDNVPNSIKEQLSAPGAGFAAPLSEAVVAQIELGLSEGM